MAARALLRSELTAALTRKAPTMHVQTRAMSSGGSHSHDVEETIRWRNITVIAYIGCAALGVYQFSKHGHHEAHERPAYSYLRIRSKEFPWGPCGLFEWDCKE